MCAAVLPEATFSSPSAFQRTLGLQDELAAILGKPQGQNATDNDRESQKIKKLRQQLSSLLSQVGTCTWAGRGCVVLCCGTT